MRILLDTGILGQLCHPRSPKNRPVARWLADILGGKSGTIEVLVPEIADYELRRKLLHLVHKGQADPKSIRRLDDLATLLDYLPLDTDTMRQAAQLWADARIQGIPTASDPALDGDVILAAQAQSVGGSIITGNRKHLSRFVAAKEWHEV